VTVFLTDMARDFAAYNTIYAEHFTRAQPCRTTLGITALPTPIAIELKCIAALPEGR
jgi:2-aminomuconate deaminase